MSIKELPRIVQLTASIVLFISCLAGDSAMAASGPEHPETTAAKARVAALEQEQRRILDGLKKSRESIADDPLSQEAQRLLERIEAEQKISRYFHPGSNSTPEMRTYYERMNQRIADCGNRNFPKWKGNSLYGKGVIVITLDRNGNALDSAAKKSSGNTLLDAHIVRLVRASSPFGVIPSKIAPADTVQADRLIVITTFDFTRGNEPAVILDQKERCRDNEVFL